MDKQRLQKQLDNLEFGFPKGDRIEYKLMLQRAEEKIKTYLSNPTYDNKKSLELTLFEALYFQGVRDSMSLHPSEISYDYCPRRAYYKMLNLPADEGFIKAVEMSLQRIFDFGTMIHLYVQYALLRAGLIDDLEVPFRDSITNISGTADGISAECIWEIKTINPYQFNKLSAPLEHHLKQASLYAHFLNRQHIVFLYVEKSSLRYKYFIVPRDESYLNQIFTSLREVRQFVIKNWGRRKKQITREQVITKPAPQRVCRSILEEKALNCPYKNLCFNNSKS